MKQELFLIIDGNNTTIWFKINKSRTKNKKFRIISNNGNGCINLKILKQRNLQTAQQGFNSRKKCSEKFTFCFILK